MILSAVSIKRAVTTSALAAAVALGPVFMSVAQALTLNGAGATFPEPLYQRYFNQIRQKYPELQVNYQAIGSGGGVRQLIAGAVDFAGSDNAMTDEQISKVESGVMFVPTAGGPVAVVYNLPGVTNLRLSRKVLPQIFTGQITNWNDPAIAADNQGVKLPDQPIRLAVRADSSGTSYIFSNHLSTIDPYFKGRFGGASTTPKWPGKPLSGKGNPGVAQIVQRTPGTIGYVEAAFAERNKLSTALLQNRKGEYVAPTLEEANQALENVKFNPDFRIDYSNLGDPAAGYPITGLTWIMLYKQYPQPGEAAAVKQMVRWILTEGQNINSELGYTRIPSSVANQVIQAVDQGVSGP